MDVDGAHKANITNAKVKLSLSAANGRRAGKEKRVLEADLESVDCICSKGDDGSPMILCSECRIWYVNFTILLFYFRCLLLNLWTDWVIVGIILLVLIFLNPRRKK